ncbi:AMP-binding protein [Acidimicrobiia bacterium EGI L10123]|uniref:AMP-binding protein n=1 Tax=Salinilacustrithrix flava TaxID=2957203 RepID=UPI003D7C2F9A|nr:AMP-binding protein [Acidimicrobiia bacterium EGI L10123]
MKELVYHRLLLPAVERYGDREVIIDGDHRGTLAEHLDRTTKLASALRTELGVGPGDRFAIMATNSHQYLELYHAAFLGAGIVNPLNLRLAPTELEFILKDSGTKVVFVDFLFANNIDMIREAAGIEKVVLIGPDVDSPHDLKYEDLLAAGEPVVPEEPEEDDPVVLMYTGGTTGLPKGVLLDQRAEMLNLYHVIMAVGIDEQSTYLHQTPMFHAASMGGLLGIPASGARSVFLPLFDPEKVMDIIEEHGVDWTVMVPTMVGMVLRHPAFRPERLASLRKLTYGASPMPEAILDRLLELYPHLELSQGYGMTEASAVLTFLDADDHRRGGDVLRSAGRPVPGVVLSVQDDDGNLLPSGETGEICARAGNFMREYWNRPEETAQAFRGGWYHTGDAGHIDGEGFVYLVDRVKDMIVTGGENVYSSEVEDAIGSHPEVDQVAVIGIPSEKWGEAVHAIVVRIEGSSVEADELIAHAREHIAGYKVPKSIDFRDEPLPLSGAMKVLKRELRAPYWEGHGRNVG